MLIRIIEIIITIDIHLFLPQKQRSYDCIHKYCMYAFVIQYLRNPDSSVRIQSYSQISYLSSNICRILTHLSVSNSNIFRVISWLVRQDPMQILSKSYPDLFVSIQRRYFFEYWSDIVSQKNTSSYSEGKLTVPLNPPPQVPVQVNRVAP